MTGAKFQRLVQPAVIATLVFLSPFFCSSTWSCSSLFSPSIEATIYIHMLAARAEARIAQEVSSDGVLRLEIGDLTEKGSHFVFAFDLPKGWKFNEKTFELKDESNSAVIPVNRIEIRDGATVHLVRNANSPAISLESKKVIFDASIQAIQTKRTVQVLINSEVLVRDSGQS